jgi:hypothetical protein
MERLARFLALLILLASSVVGLAHAQGGNGISSPRDNAVVSGVVLIEGTATDPNFLRYELAFFKEFDPLGDWVVFATGEQPVVKGVLASWDTTVGRDVGAPFYVDGTYRLRLRVVRQDSNYDEFFVLGISLDNEQELETPTETPESEATATPLPTSAIAVPTDLPTLTPFPTATPRPTAAADEETVSEDQSESESGGSILELDGEFSTEQIMSGLCLGGRLAIVFFILLAAYYLFRSGLRSLISRLREWLSR